jgi:hypothetical protein
VSPLPGVARLPPTGEALAAGATRGHYLLHRSDELGEFSLASDAAVASFRHVSMVQDEPEQLKEFLPGDLGWTPGIGIACRRCAYTS